LVRGVTATQVKDWSPWGDSSKLWGAGPSRGPRLSAHTSLRSDWHARSIAASTRERAICRAPSHLALCCGSPWKVSPSVTGAEASTAQETRTMLQVTDGLI